MTKKSTKKSEPYHHGDLHTALLNAATKMIAEGGVESVTLRALGKRIGVSRMAPYRHFDDKAALLAAVAQEGFVRLGNQLQAITHPDPITRLRHMGIAYVQFAINNPTHYHLMFGSDIIDTTLYPDLQNIQQSVFDLLHTTIEACQSLNSVKSGDSQALVYVVWSSVHGLASLLIDQRVHSQMDVEALISLTTQTIIDGISP